MQSLVPACHERHLLFSPADFRISELRMLLPLGSTAPLVNNRACAEALAAGVNSISVFYILLPNQNRTFNNYLAIRWLYVHRTSFAFRISKVTFSLGQHGPRNWQA
jgi:hypothetical protein